MMPLAKVAFLRVLPLVISMIVARSATPKQGKETPGWTAYIDAVNKVCIRRKDASLGMKLTTMLQCFKAQRKQVQCLPSRHFLDRSLAYSAASVGLQAPCGLIHFFPKTENSFTRRRWTITVQSQLYINLTFLEFALSMPYGRCDRYQGSEQLVIHHQANTSDLILKDAVFLCGRYSPFSMVWENRGVLLVYTKTQTSTSATTQTGHFRIQYQVCDQGIITHKVQTIHNSSVLQISTSLWFKVIQHPSFENRPTHVVYTIHLLGNRLRFLDMLFAFPESSKNYIHVDTFDGPGPAPIHRHPIQHQKLNTNWIYFLTFQAYLQITCENHYCEHVFIKYRMPPTHPYISFVKLTKDKDVPFSVVTMTDFCLDGHLWYCLFGVEASTTENVEISVQRVTFHGPDYLGGLGEPRNCLLAGITIADGYRANFISNDKSYFEQLGDIPRDLAVDSILPEITTCFDTPLAVGDRLIRDFPVKTFVSYGPILMLMIYVYGAYVDLSKLDIRLIVRPSHSAGLIVSCPSIPADGYLGIGTVSISGYGSISHGKLSICPLGNILFVKLTSLRAERSRALSAQVVFCTNQQKKMTTVLISPYLSNQSGFGAVRSLFVQKNPYTTETEMDCHLIVEEATLPSNIDYKLHVRVPEIVSSNAYTVAATSLASGTHIFGNRGQLTGRYLTIHIYMIIPHINVEINVSLSCTKAVPLTGESDQEFQRHLERAQSSHNCPSYVIPLWSNDTRNNTHLIYLSTLYYITNFEHVIHSKGKMGNLTALLFDWDMSRFLFIVNIALHSTCSQFWHHMRVQITYRALVSHNIVSLEWNILLTSSGFQIILSDMPMSEVLIYITSINDRSIGKGCLASIDINKSTKDDYKLSISDGSNSDQRPFVEYQLLWTHKEYTWKEAEHMCQQLGDMHVASIATGTEYLLISRMLLGSAYHDMDTDDFLLPILSPCLMGSPLCVIYIGLRRQKAGFSWSDGRPTGYLRWNANYFTRHGPNGVKYYSQTNSTENGNFDQLLMEARSILQPQYTNKTLCTVLIGSPGPHDMEFVSIPCDRKIKVSGIMCIKGGNELKAERPLYRLTHMKLKAKSSQLVTHAKEDHFNVDILYEALFKGKKPPETQGSSGLPVYFENFNEEEYAKEYHLKSQKIQRTWTQSIQSCSSSSHNINLCDLLWPYKETSTKYIQNLTTDLFTTGIDQNSNQNTSLSIQKSNDYMIASKYCRPGEFLNGRECIYFLQIQPGSGSLSLNQLCQTYLSEAPAKVYVIEGDLRALSSILQKLDLANEQVICLNKLGKTVVLFFDAENLRFRVYEQNDRAFKYVVCSLEPIQPTCPPAYFSCNNACISEQFLCDGKVDCKDGTDEQNCTHLCKALNASPRYCLTKCHPQNCTCHELYFHCPSGGCIYSSKICDGHADCIDAEDESFCFSPMSVSPSIDRKNDFIPDQADSLDEEIYINVLRSVRKEVASTCGSLHYVPCVKGHPACYSADKMCLYDHTEDGRLKYCGNGFHLLECDYFQCSASFKCRHSYCIPTYKVCNGIQDCPYGDDEVMCPVSVCIKMLRCGDKCVHPNNMCDGNRHCELGEDELACDAPTCPPTCHCSGYAMKCYSLIMLDTTFQRVTMFSLKRSKLLLVKHFFRHLASLLILDISYCNVTSVPSEGLFLEHSALVKLNLSHNGLRSLAYGSLQGLINLVELDLSWNPLSYLEPQVFAHMRRLRTFSLRHCQLSLLLDGTLPNTQSLDMLDVSFGGRMKIGCLSLRVAVFNLIKTTVLHYKDYTKKCWRNVGHVVSEQTGLYCLNFLREKPDGDQKTKSWTCQSLFPSKTLFIYCCILIIIITTSNVCALIYKLLLQNTDAFLICNLALANSIIIVSMYIFSKWHVSYDTEFNFFEQFLSRSIYCRLSGDILVVSTHIATVLQTIISLQKYYGTVRPRNVLSEHKLNVYLAVAAAWVIPIIVCTCLRFQDVQSTETSTLLEGLFYDYHYKNLVLNAFSILNTFFTLATTFSYGKVLKNIHKTLITRIGLKHGRDTVLSEFMRVALILLLSNASSFAVVFSFIALVSLGITKRSQAVALIFLTFPLQAVFNPFLFTLSTQRFLNDCRRCFSYVKKWLLVHW